LLFLGSSDLRGSQLPCCEAIQTVCEEVQVVRNWGLHKLKKNLASHVRNHLVSVSCDSYHLADNYNFGSYVCSNLWESWVRISWLTCSWIPDPQKLDHKCFLLC
jgi:hypothetical protein